MRGTGLQRVLTQAIAIGVLLFATPVAVELGQELVCVVTGVECCDDSCESGRGGDCSDGCAQCACCAPSAVAAAPQPGPREPAPALLGFVWHLERRDASGYRAAPFRPPAS